MLSIECWWLSLVFKSPPSFLGFAFDDSNWNEALQRCGLLLIISVSSVITILVLRLGLFYVFQGRWHYKLKILEIQSPGETQHLEIFIQDRIRLLWCWLPSWYQSKWHRQVGQEASLFEQCPSEHPQEDRCEEPRCAISPQQQQCSKSYVDRHGILESVQELPSSAQLL